MRTRPLLNRRLPHRLLIYLVGLWLALVIFSIVASASSLSDYRSRVEAAQKNVETMTGVLEDNKFDADVFDYLNQSIAGIKKSLPETEDVQFRGTSVTASNAWIRSKFEEFNQKATTSERVSVLSSISERLSAITSHIRQLEEASSSSRTKD